MSLSINKNVSSNSAPEVQPATAQLLTRRADLSPQSKNDTYVWIDPTLTKPSSSHPKINALGKIDPDAALISIASAPVSIHVLQILSETLHEQFGSQKVPAELIRSFPDSLLNKVKSVFNGNLHDDCGELAKVVDQKVSGIIGKHHNQRFLISPLIEGAATQQLQSIEAELTERGVQPMEDHFRLRPAVQNALSKSIDRTKFDLLSDAEFMDELRGYWYQHPYYRPMLYLSRAANIAGGGLSVVIALEESRRVYHDPNFLNFAVASSSVVSAAGFISSGGAQITSALFPGLKPGALVLSERALNLARGSGAIAITVIGVRHFVNDIQDETSSLVRLSTGPLMAIGGLLLTLSVTGRFKIVKDSVLTLGEIGVAVVREFGIEKDTRRALIQALYSELDDRRGSFPLDLTTFEIKFSQIIAAGHLDDDVVHQVVKYFAQENPRGQSLLHHQIFQTPLFAGNDLMYLGQIPAEMRGKTLLEIFEGILKADYNIDILGYDTEALERIKPYLPR